MIDYKKYIAELLVPHVWLSEEEVVALIERPLDSSHGDFAFPCFTLAMTLKKSPIVLATELQAAVVLDTSIVSSAQAMWPYVNFFVHVPKLASELINTISKQKDQFGAGVKKKERLMIESPGPNTNKPLHLWHVRNMLLGNALEAIARFAGYDVTRVDIINDRGVHICKSMLAYQLFGNNAEPDKKGDHFVGERYVLFDKKNKEDPSMEEKAQEMLRDWEDGDPEVRALWKKMNDWAINGMQETYARYGVTIDKAYAESDHYLKGKDVVQQWLDQGIFVRDEKWNIVFLDEAENIKKVVLRADGTSIYITQDIVLAGLRYEDYKMDKMVYVVANEQIDHFKALFAIFKKLGYSFANDCYHLAYGYISLPSGRMKSREGTVVDADDVADSMHADALALIKQRYPELSDAESHVRAEQIAMAAIKFFMLKYDVFKDFIFDIEESLSFDGETGPYLQYTHARCCSVLQKAGVSFQPSTGSDFGLLQTEEERLLLIHLYLFPQCVAQSAEKYTPDNIARYALTLAQLFNGYYQKQQFIVEDPALQKARLALVSSVRQTMENALRIIGIEAPQQM